MVVFSSQPCLHVVPFPQVQSKRTNEVQSLSDRIKYPRNLSWSGEAIFASRRSRRSMGKHPPAPHLRVLSFLTRIARLNSMKWE